MLVLTRILSPLPSVLALFITTDLDNTVHTKTLRTKKCTLVQCSSVTRSWDRTYEAIPSYRECYALFEKKSLFLRSST